MSATTTTPKWLPGDASHAGDFWHVLLPKLYRRTGKQAVQAAGRAIGLAPILDAARTTLEKDDACERLRWLAGELRGAKDTLARATAEAKRVRAERLDAAQEVGTDLGPRLAALDAQAETAAGAVAAAQKTVQAIQPMYDEARVAADRLIRQRVHARQQEVRTSLVNRRCILIEQIGEVAAELLNEIAATDAALEQTVGDLGAVAEQVLNESPEPVAA